jgi:hypothetical protein
MFSKDPKECIRLLKYWSSFEKLQLFFKLWGEERRVQRFGGEI